VNANLLTWTGNTGTVLQDFANDPTQSVTHAILIVGWDNTQGAWIIKNSWGAWGINDSGFGYVKYQCNNIGWGAAWVKTAP
jgi:C1A family cysteine protease